MINKYLSCCSNVSTFTLNWLRQSTFGTHVTSGWSSCKEFSRDTRYNECRGKIPYSMPTEWVKFIAKEIIKLFPSEIEVNNIIICNYVQHYLLQFTSIYKKFVLFIGYMEGSTWR